MTKQIKKQIGRPDKLESAIIEQRNKKLILMFKQGYPITFLGIYFNLNRATVSRLLKTLIPTKK